MADYVRDSKGWLKHWQKWNEGLRNKKIIKEDSKKRWGDIFRRKKPRSMPGMYGQI